MVRTNPRPMRQALAVLGRIGQGYPSPENAPLPFLPQLTADGRAHESVGYRSAQKKARPSVCSF